MQQLSFGGKELMDPVSILQRIGVSFGMTVADFGCGGLGFFTLPAARLVGSDGKVFAVDILKSSLASVESLAKQAGLHNITTVWSNLEVFRGTNMPEQSADRGLLINTLYQSEKHQDVLREAYRLLKAHGKLLVIDWNVQGSPLGPKPQLRVAPERLRDMAESVGYVAEETFDAGQYHYGVLFAKRI